MSTISIHHPGRPGRLAALLSAILHPIVTLGQARHAAPEGTPAEFSDPVTWNAVRCLPPHILRDIGFYD